MKKWKRAALLICAAFLAALAGLGAIGNVYGKSPESSETRIVKNKTGVITIEYKDESLPLSGAEFTFYRVINKGKAEAGKAQTDRNGNAQIRLPEGDYEVRETKSVSGYSPSSAFQMTVPMDDGNGVKSYSIRIIPKPVRSETKVSTKTVKTGNPSEKKEEAVLQKLLPVKTSDDGNGIIYLVILGSAAVVVGTMVRIRINGRKS